ncbi:MAG TPA: recombination mediator RecR [Candidatus Paceibacterota bacterium]|nr:recombination mediator RecR [Candidatus Paceibacterota bacterium]
MTNRHFDNLVQLLSRLPGIGPRHATRIVLSLVDRPASETRALADAVAALPASVRLCGECFNVSENGRCGICGDTTRESASLLVVERVSDLQAVERAGAWRGMYHVLGGTLEPGDNEHGKLRVPELIARLRKLVSGDKSAEAVLATGTDADGDATAMFIARELGGIPGIRVTRLARGLSTGAHLEYADELTLRHALESRK